MQTWPLAARAGVKRRAMAGATGAATDEVRCRRLARSSSSSVSPSAGCDAMPGRPTLADRELAARRRSWPSTCSTRGTAPAVTAPMGRLGAARPLERSRLSGAGRRATGCARSSAEGVRARAMPAFATRAGGDADRAADRRAGQRHARALGAARRGPERRRCRRTTPRAPVVDAGSTSGLRSMPAPARVPRPRRQGRATAARSWTVVSRAGQRSGPAHDGHRRATGPRHAGLARRHRRAPLTPAADLGRRGLARSRRRPVVASVDAASDRALTAELHGEGAG